MKQVLFRAVAVSLAVATSAVAAEIVDGVAAVVNDRVITYSEVKNYVQPLVAQLRRNFVGDELVDRIRKAQMDALNGLIERALIIQQFKENGYSIPEKVVDGQIEDFIASDFGGDRASFIKTLAAQNMTLSQFRERERERIIVQAMLNRKTQREVVVSPYKIEKYYKDHPDDFKVDNQIKLRMIFIKKGQSERLPASAVATPSLELPVTTNATNAVTGPVPDDLAAPVETTEVARAEAASNPMLATPPLDPHRTLAEEILAKLDAGESFDSMARVYSEGKEAKQGGDWGWIGKDVLRKELNEIAFKLKPGEHSKIIETDEGFYILQVDDVKPAHSQSMPEVRNQIEKILLQEQRTKMQDDWVKELRSKAYIRLF
jgi:parvulin-like peptidyl-prolyl isomerase